MSCFDPDPYLSTILDRAQAALQRGRIELARSIVRGSKLKYHSRLNTWLESQGLHPVVKEFDESFVSWQLRQETKYARDRLANVMMRHNY